MDDQETIITPEPDRTLMDAAERIDDLRAQIRTLNERVEALEAELAEVETEKEEMEEQLLDQPILSDQYARLVELIDDLFGVRFLPLPLRLALANFGREVGAREVIFG
jgi:septal ring factor EnvC (AmiA/AmiB activator)